MNKLDVTFVIPCYNCAAYVGRTLDSILKQELKSFEIIAVNDCSTDDTLAVLEGYAAKISQLRVVSHKANKNLGAARNTGIGYSLGEFVYFIDSDDWLNDGGVSQLLHLAQKKSADVVACGVQLVSSDGNVTPYHAWSFESTGGREGVEFFSKYQIGAIAWNKLYRLSFLRRKNITFIEGYYHEDIIFTARVALECSRYISIEDVHMNYFQNSESICNQIPGRKHMASYVNLYVNMSLYYRELFSRGISDLNLIKRLARNYGALEIFPKLERYAITRKKSDFVGEVYDAVYELLGPDGFGVADLICASFEKFSIEG